MSDVKTTEEPSIEEILGSIRRIIADDDEQLQGTTASPSPASVEEEEDESPLELTQKIDEDGTIIDMHDDIAADAETTAPAPTFAQTLADEIIMIDEADQEPSFASDPLVSQTAAAATAAVMAKLARNTSINRQGNEGTTLEDLVKEMIRPMLSEWLDQNLPRLVQSMVERELDKISRRVG